MNDLQHTTEMTYSKNKAIREFCFPETFFLDEVRENFFIPSMMKRFWAEQLAVLREIQRICERHRISWWIADGTLLGAVRHHGFIPWDDDIDIVMLRPDWERFLSVAQSELPEGYIVLSIIEQPDFMESTNKVTNGQIINDAANYLMEHYGCPFIAGVDIFVLDARYRDSGKEKKRSNVLKLVQQAIDTYKAGIGSCSGEEEKRLQAIEKQADCILRRDDHLNYDLLMLREKLCSEAPFEDADELEVFWDMNFRYIYKKAWFEKTTFLLFEGIPLPAPVAFTQVLQAEYGDYSRIVRSGGAHTYPAYCHQEKMLEEKGGHNVRRYTFRREDAFQKRPMRREEQIRQITDILDRASTQTKQLLERGDENGARQLLQKCEHLTYSLEILLNHTPEILFLVMRPEWWGGIMEQLWKQLSSGEQATVHVVCVPWSEKRADGSDGIIHNEIDNFPPGLNLKNVNDYDLGKRRPDRIYTPYPFDASHPGMDIPEAFYAENLRRVTDDLVYIPCFEIPDPAPDDSKALHNLHILIEQPAVIWSDHIIVPSPLIRQLYIDQLCTLAGKDSESMWEKKIISW